MKKSRLLRSVSAKTNPLLIVAIIFIALVLFGVIDLSGFELPSFSAGTIGEEGKVPVEKQVQFSLINKYSGSALGSKTLTVYSGESLATLHSLTTDSNGLAQTPVPYESGTEFFVKYESSNDKQWFQVTVPKMNEKDAEAQTYNTVGLESFAVGTYTSDTLMCSGSSIADAGSYNLTTSGATPTFSYTLANSGSDNTGLIDSYDPVYDCDYEVWVTITFSGTNYETIVLSGFDNQFTLGSVQYGMDRMSSESLTKWKIGNDYVSGYTGTDTVSFNLDLSGYSGDAVTMQITAYAYADPGYAETHGGNFGPEKVEIAEQTVTLVD